MKLGPYEVQEEIGRGGMGTVYRARSPDGRDLAVKVLAFAPTATEVARFERERRLLDTLGAAEGFVPLLDAGVSAQGPYLVMPFLAGGTLRDRLRRGPIPVNGTLALARSLASALGKAHARGIVHRDLKPENVLYDEEERPFVADLGLAKHFRHDVPGASRSAALTGEGLIAGTLGYMAPEQLNDAAKATPASDVFSLGAILYECLAGRPAFSGAGLMSFVTHIRSSSYEPLARLRAETPEWLSRVVARALAWNPRERYEDGSELALALAGGDLRPARRRAALVAGALGLGAGALAAGLAFMQESKDASPRPVPAPASADGAPVSDADRALAQRLAESAVVSQRAGRLDEALDLASRAIALDPGRARIWSVRASIDLDRSRYDSALADATRAIELDPKLAPAWGNRSAARNQRGDHVGALADATRAIELDPGMAPGWVNRGSAAFDLGKQEEAISDFTRAIELQPRLARAWYNRGRARHYSGALDEAVADFDRAIELDARSASFWAQRGNTRFEAGDLPGAETDLNRALELDPKYTFALKGRLLVRVNRGDEAGARLDLREIERQDPKDPDIPNMRAAIRQAFE
ncbi:tetratricopeptide repeat protein [bacterium]|nr:tetratricopeptide repeat protein [bacterium]